jgi:hypothetical protein
MVHAMVSSRNPNTYLSVYQVCQSITPHHNDITTNSSFSQQEYFDQMLQCIGEANGQSIDTFFLTWAACLVFFMQAGFAMLCAGCVQFKNVQNTMLKNLLDACGAALGL